MVGALDSGSSGLGSIPGQGTALFSWARHLTLTVPLFILGPVVQKRVKS